LPTLKRTSPRRLWPLAVLVGLLLSVLLVALASAETVQRGNVRLAVNGALSPKRLPRSGTAPIAVNVGWQLQTTDGAPPPVLKNLSIAINRAGRFDLEGLPTCPYAKIQPASTNRALANCRDALVGRGNFAAQVALGGQESYAATGQMLIFNGRQGKKPVLFGQIYSPRPFASSFVIVFALDTTSRGTYGTEMKATLPSSLRAWGALTEVQMKLSRRFGYGGQSRSFISAGCPAPSGFTKAVFPLARTEFTYLGGLKQSLVLSSDCETRG
jgi:hypothetical protein